MRISREYLLTLTREMNSSIGNLSLELKQSYSSLQKAPSRDLSNMGSRTGLNKVPKKDKQTAQQAALLYKIRKQLEGEESEKAPETTGVLKWKWSKREDTELYSLKFSPDGHYLAAAGGNGSISVYSMANNTKEFVLDPKMDFNVPCTAIAFRPDLPNYKNKNVFAASYSDGTIRHWHCTSGQQMSVIKENDVQFLHVTYSKQGHQFSTCASDNNIRIFDGKTHQIIFHGKNIEERGTIGHTNRIFCSKFHPKDQNMIVSGGWDDNVLIWDIRVPNPVRTLFGPRICGDSLDFDDSGSRLLTGSYDRDKNLQLWSWNSGQLEETIHWNPSIQARACMLYSAQFSKDCLRDGIGANRFILGGGAGAVNEVRLFSCESKKLVGSVEDLNCAIYSTAMTQDDKTIAIGGGGKMIMVFEIDETVPDTK